MHHAPPRAPAPAQPASAQRLGVGTLGHGVVGEARRRTAASSLPGAGAGPRTGTGTGTATLLVEHRVRETAAGQRAASCAGCRLARVSRRPRGAGGRKHRLASSVVLVGGGLAALRSSRAAFGTLGGQKDSRPAIDASPLCTARCYCVTLQSPTPLHRSCWIPLTPHRASCWRFQMRGTSTKSACPDGLVLRPTDGLLGGGGAGIASRLQAFAGCG
ncbi:hypothetical protein P154DRAFT_567571 [Amniculicola lignicola CBS 123094]|uniref:Uncharacterized protein n=1 Tax=Amniculicola lignicola CBS 123094 TaxID=1392246 RepID=A0A6A5W4J2_9PLEO|nr:hypothetical protein P154DRAFT_567571 [Amniculicola lignicola CBS 123094]